jgi:hypothetical protein
MPTTFVYTTFAVITVLNGAGQLAPVDKADLPAGTAGPILFTEAQCNFVRGKMANPEKYVCQVFTSPAETQLVWTAPGFVMPAAASPAGRQGFLTPKALDDVKVGPSKLEERDKPEAVAPAKEIESKAPPVDITPPKQKKVAQQPHYQRQAMFEGNPLTGFFSW